MRNWNGRIQAWKITKCYSSFHLTYEELKLSSSFRVNSVSRCFHLTYEELKPKRKAERRWWWLCRFSSYLWGIETRCVHCFSWSVQRFSSYLWGIETFSRPVYFVNESKFSSYLWGIETRGWALGLLEQNFVFILPMRNWNRKPRLANHSITSFSSYLWGIETNCLVLRQTSWFLRFHLTYEELKLRCSYFFFSIWIIVFILPMRNWNRNVPSMNWILRAFSSYLWGIETAKKRRRTWRKGQFSSYLWGIETIQMLRQVPAIFLFSSYLWGIETAIWQSYGLCACGFHLTYEELKLGRTLSVLWHRQVFILPMRNWNWWNSARP